MFSTHYFLKSFDLLNKSSDQGFRNTSQFRVPLHLSKGSAKGLEGFTTDY